MSRLGPEVRLRTLFTVGLLSLACAGPASVPSPSPSPSPSPAVAPEPTVLTADGQAALRKLPASAWAMTLRDGQWGFVSGCDFDPDVWVVEGLPDGTWWLRIQSIDPTDVRVASAVERDGGVVVSGVDVHDSGVLQPDGTSKVVHEEIPTEWTIGFVDPAHQVFTVDDGSGEPLRFAVRDAPGVPRWDTPCAGDE